MSYDWPKKKTLFSLIHAKNCIGFLYSVKGMTCMLTGDAVSPINSHQSPSNRVMWWASVQRNDGLTDSPMFILMVREKIIGTVDQWLWLWSFQTAHYRITSIIRFNFFSLSLAKFLFKIILEYDIFFYSKKRKSDSLLTVWKAYDQISKTLSHQIIPNLSK